MLPEFIRLWSHMSSHNIFQRDAKFASSTPVAIPIKRKPLFHTTLLAIWFAFFSIGAFAQSGSYAQSNIISDGSVPAAQVDPTLINPWGVSVGPDLWIDAAGTGFSLVDSIAGAKSFAVSIPPAASTSAHGSPAGTVYNTNSSIFNIPNSTSAVFLFGTLDGTIAAWNANTPQAVTVVNNSAAHASYTDIALDTNANGTFLLAANFALGRVDVFNSTFAPATLAGSFTDSQIPSGFSPFGIHSIAGKIYVTYAQMNPANGREAVGAGLGYVDVFDTSGNLLQHAINQGVLNAPWGMALAPSGFGPFAGDILVGNFGDGTINAFDPNTFAMIGQVQDATGAAIVNTGLWEIFFGQNGVGDPNTLYFAAGINGEKDGLFGSIAVATPSTGSPDFSFTSPSKSIAITSGQSGTLSMSLTGSNGFSGPVSFSCSGLPSGDNCNFTPSTVTLSGSTASSVSVSIATTPATPSTPSPYTVGLSGNNMHRGFALAFLSPFGMLAFAGIRRKSSLTRKMVLLLAFGVFSLAAIGCSSSPSQKAAAQNPPTPASSQITINATSGSITHSLNVTLTIM